MSDLVVAMLADRPGSSGSGLWPSGSLGLLPWVESPALTSDDGVAESSDGCPPFPAAAAAACCWAISFLDAFPRFLRSRMYSHVKPNSAAVLAYLSDVVTLG